jgi:hypothetical protein
MRIILDTVTAARCVQSKFDTGELAEVAIAKTSLVLWATAIRNPFRTQDLSSLNPNLVLLCCCTE